MENITKIRILMAATAITVGGYALKVSIDEDARKNPFKITTFQDVNRNVPYLGERQPLFRYDVNGDKKADAVILYSGGHAFYSDSYDFDQGGFHMPSFHRIYPDTPEAETLKRIHPDFTLARPAKKALQYPTIM